MNEYEETLWVVLRIWNHVGVPIAWRMTEADANYARDGFVSAWDTKTRGHAFFITLPVINGISDRIGP